MPSKIKRLTGDIEIVIKKGKNWKRTRASERDNTCSEDGYRCRNRDSSHQSRSVKRVNDPGSLARNARLQHRARERHSYTRVRVWSSSRDAARPATLDLLSLFLSILSFPPLPPLSPFLISWCILRRFPAAVFLSPHGLLHITFIAFFQNRITLIIFGFCSVFVSEAALKSENRYGIAISTYLGAMLMYPKAVRKYSEH